MAATKIKLAIGVPAYGGQIAAHQIEMWLSLGEQLQRSDRFEQVMVGHVDINGVQRARNRMIANAMMAPADWLLMIDADTWVEQFHGVSAGHQILRMIDEADRSGFAVIAAPVRWRSAAFTGDRHAPIAAFIDGGRLNSLDLPHGIINVTAVGAACMAIDLHAVNSANAVFAFTDKLSEDLEFCRQMRAHDFQIGVDGRMSTGHLSRPVPLYSAQRKG